MRKGPPEQDSPVILNPGNVRTSSFGSSTGKLLNKSLTMGDRPISVGELRQHKTIPNKVWIVIDSIVWDITSFLPEHPGGPNSEYAVMRMYKD